MGYDYRSSASSPVGSIAPVDRSGYDIRDTIVAYTARVSPSKVILGVPYYGRAWSTSSSSANAGEHELGEDRLHRRPSPTTRPPTYLARYGRRYDANEQVAWTAYRRQNCTATYGCVTSWRQLYVDDAAAIGRKYDLVNQYGLRGAGIWALGYDGTRPELSNTIQAKFINDTTPPTVGIRTLPVRTINPAILGGVDRAPTTSGSPAYDIQVSIDGGPWVDRG